LERKIKFQFQIFFIKLSIMQRWKKWQPTWCPN